MSSYEDRFCELSELLEKFEVACARVELSRQGEYAGPQDWAELIRDKYKIRKSIEDLLLGKESE